MTLEDKMKELYKDICKQMEEYQKTCDDLYSDYYDLQKRVDKAVNFMERRDLDWGSEEHDYMLKLLKGENK